MMAYGYIVEARVCDSSLVDSSQCKWIICIEGVETGSMDTTVNLIIGQLPKPWRTICCLNNK